MAIGKLDGSIGIIKAYQQRIGESWTFINLGAATSTSYKRSGSIAGKVLRRTEDKMARSTISGMVTECEFVAEWLESGRMPGDYHGVSRNCVPWENDWIDEYQSPYAYSIDRSENQGLSKDQRERIKKALTGLSRREKQCYMLNVVDGMSIRDIGLELQLSKGTVQDYINRAGKKIEANKNSSLFLAE